MILLFHKNDRELPPPSKNNNIMYFFSSTQQSDVPASYFIPNNTKLCQLFINTLQFRTAVQISKQASASLKSVYAPGLILHHLPSRCYLLVSVCAPTTTPPHPHFPPSTPHRACRGAAVQRRPPTLLVILLNSVPEMQL